MNNLKCPKCDSENVVVWTEDNESEADKQSMDDWKNFAIPIKPVNVKPTTYAKCKDCDYQVSRTVE